MTEDEVQRSRWTFYEVVKFKNVNRIHMQKVSSLLAFTLLGCYAIVVQVLFIREFMVVFFGSELCLGIIFASWLVGISLGAGAGAKFIKRFKEFSQYSLFFR